ncbi:hypothetical protein J500_1781 [Acinetobacter sp. 479375]|nr:hypothetical protein J500_1781 [Acinetobacter sp. 479375]
MIAQLSKLIRLNLSSEIDEDYPKYRVIDHGLDQVNCL